MSIKGELYGRWFWCKVFMCEFLLAFVSLLVVGLVLMFLCVFSVGCFKLI